MGLSPLAGKPAPEDLLIDVKKLEQDYLGRKPDLNERTQQVTFGTSGHRGTPFNGTFSEGHILAATQAICDFRTRNGINGPLFIGKDSHAISDAAQRTAIEVLAANDVQTFVQAENGIAPTPSISHAILTYNRDRQQGLADGIMHRRDVRSERRQASR